MEFICYQQLYTQYDKFDHKASKSKMAGPSAHYAAERPLLNNPEGDQGGHLGSALQTRETASLAYSSLNNALSLHSW